MWELLYWFYQIRFFGQKGETILSKHSKKKSETQIVIHFRLQFIRENNQFSWKIQMRFLRPLISTLFSDSLSSLFCIERKLTCHLVVPFWMRIKWRNFKLIWFIVRTFDNYSLFQNGKLGISRKLKKQSGNGSEKWWGNQWPHLNQIYETWYRLWELYDNLQAYGIVCSRW